jgi:hypothetical protein
MCETEMIAASNGEYDSADGFYLVDCFVIQEFAERFAGEKDEPYRRLELMSPTGSRIVGTLETINGVAIIGTVKGTADDGTYLFDYSGDTDIDYDTQFTVEQLGQRMFEDEHGERWLECELTIVAA